MHLGAITKQLARAGSRGQILPLAAVSLVVLFGAGALAVDVGDWRHQQRLEQSAADSAAIAAASEMAYVGSTDYKAAAMADAASNGFTDGVATTSVVVHNPPQSGAYVNNNNAVEVIVTKSKPAFFVGINQPIQARAVALVSTAGGPPCIVALNGDITLNGGGGGGVTAPKCGVYTNKDLVVNGSNAQIDAPTIGYVGAPPSGGTYPLGQPHQSLPVADPCLTIPSCANLANLTSTQLHPGCSPQPNPLPNPLPPGEYCQTLTPSGNFSFAGVPGQLYILDQGMTVNGNATLTGTDVTIYNGGAASLTGITFSGNLSINLTAPTTGPYAGMVFFQPPTNTQPFIDNGRAGSDNFQGGMYMPTADFTNNGTIPSVSILVAKSIRMNGGGLGDSANAGGNSGGSAPRAPVLVE